MNYIYDVITNFNDNYYDFYEWNKKDKLIHFKKLPIIKIKKEDYNNILINEICINNNNLKQIKNKAEIWDNKNNINNYYVLITNGTDIIGLELNNKGIVTKRSSLLVDEELDILYTIRKLNTKEIKYEIIKKININFKTRNEIIKNQFIKNEINNLSLKKDINKINYIYYECFNKKEKNTKLALKNILNNIDKYEIQTKLDNFFNLIKTTNK